MLLKVNNRNYDIIKYLVLGYYFLGTSISLTYFDIFHPLSLSSLIIFIVFVYLKSIKKFKVNKFIFLFITYHLLITLLHQDISDFLSILLYSVVVLAMSWSSKDNMNYYIYAITIIIMNYVNFFLLQFLPMTNTRYKSIGNIDIQVNYFDDIKFSGAALTALLTMILVFSFKSKNIKTKVLKITSIFSSLFIIFTLGKISVILGLVISVIVSQILFYKGNFLKISKLFSKLILFFTFFSGFLLSKIIELTAFLNINYSLLTSRRDAIWYVYIDYFYNSTTMQKLFGSFLVGDNNDIIKTGLIHPHNQWITILISTGLIGLFFYLILFIKAYNFTIEQNDRIGFTFILALNIFGTTDDYILLTAGCINAFLLIYYASKKQKVIVDTTNDN